MTIKQFDPISLFQLAIETGEPNIPVEMAYHTGYEITEMQRQEIMRIEEENDRYVFDELDAIEMLNADYNDLEETIELVSNKKEISQDDFIAIESRHPGFFTNFGLSIESYTPVPSEMGLQASIEAAKSAKDVIFVIGMIGGLAMIVKWMFKFFKFSSSVAKQFFAESPEKTAERLEEKIDELRELASNPEYADIFVNAFNDDGEFKQSGDDVKPEEEKPDNNEGGGDSGDDGKVKPMTDVEKETLKRKKSIFNKAKSIAGRVKGRESKSVLKAFGIEKDHKEYLENLRKIGKSLNYSDLAANAKGGTVLQVATRQIMTSGKLHDFLTNNANLLDKHKDNIDDVIDKSSNAMDKLASKAKSFLDLNPTDKNAKGKVINQELVKDLNIIFDGVALDDRSGLKLDEFEAKLTEIRPVAKAKALDAGNLKSLDNLEDMMEGCFKLYTALEKYNDSAKMQKLKTAITNATKAKEQIASQLKQKKEDPNADKGSVNDATKANTDLEKLTDTSQAITKYVESVGELALDLICFYYYSESLINIIQRKVADKKQNGGNNDTPTTEAEKTAQTKQEVSKAESVQQAAGNVTPNQPASEK